MELAGGLDQAAVRDRLANLGADLSCLDDHGHFLETHCRLRQNLRDEIWPEHRRHIDEGFTRRIGRQTTGADIVGALLRVDEQECCESAGSVLAILGEVVHNVINQAADDMAEFHACIDH